MENLLSHPRVFMPEPVGQHSTGDIHFFDLDRQEGRINHARGIAWYRSLFAAARPDQATGEKTADYLADSYACDLIYTTMGAIRIIIVLRDPVERTYSHFWHARHTLPAQYSFSKLVTDGHDIGDSRILSASFYNEAVQRYINTFGHENVCAVILDDLLVDPTLELKRICTFLGIEADQDFPLKHKRVNRGTSSAVARFLLRGATRLHSAAPSLYAYTRDSLLGKYARAFIGKRRGTRQYASDNRHNWASTYPPMSPGDRRHLQNVFCADVRRLSNTLGRDLETLWWDEQIDS